MKTYKQKSARRKAREYDRNMKNRSSLSVKWRVRYNIFDDKTGKYVVGTNAYTTPKFAKSPTGPGFDGDAAAYIIRVYGHMGALRLIKA